MQIVADEVQRIATLLGADYMRTVNLSEADVNVHYQTMTLPLIIYNGEGEINTTFEIGWSQPIDYFNTQLYFLVKATTTDLTGEEIDALLQTTKELANKFYLEANTVVDVTEYSLQPVEILDDFLIGHEMNIVLNFYNEGC